MEENFNWNLASNAQLKGEIESLENDFADRQNELKGLVAKMDEINTMLVEMSSKYNYLKDILSKREGKNKGV